MAELELLPQFAPLLEPYTYKVLVGGRSRGGSVACAQAALYYASRASMRIVLLREYQNSIAESSKAQIEWAIRQAKDESSWKIAEQYIEHKKTHSAFTFLGMSKDTSKVKSYTDIDLAIFEEAENASQQSLTDLIPTVRKDGSQIWFNFNPRDRFSPVAQMFIENDPPPNSIIIRSTFLENPFNSAKTLADAEHMRLTDPALYDHVWMGNYLDKSQLRMVPFYNLFDPDNPAPELDNDICVCGIDIARDGDDSTVICVRKGRSVLFISAYSNMDSDKLVGELFAINAKYHCDRYNMDTTGHGAWSADAPRKAGLNVVSINFAANARKDKHFSNQRTELYSLAREYFENGGTIPRGALKLQAELEYTPYTLDNKNRIAMLPKLEIKRYLKRSPDYSDAFCLSLMGDNGNIFGRSTQERQISNEIMKRNLLNAGSYDGKYNSSFFD
jgi:phage terminase large subunit